MRLRLAATQTATGDLRLHLEIPAEAKLLANAESAWLFPPPVTFSQIAPELPAAYRGLFRQDVTIPMAGLSGFLDRESSTLRRHFEFEPPVSQHRHRERKLSFRCFALKIEGSLNHLAAELEAQLDGRTVTITSRGYIPRNPAEVAASATVEGLRIQRTGCSAANGL
jgi:hypothetical protein